MKAYTYSATERVRRFLERHRSACAVAALAVVVLALVAVGAVSRILEERDAARAARDWAVREKRATAALGLSLLTDFHIRLRTHNRLHMMKELGDVVTSYLGSIPSGLQEGAPIDIANRLELHARMNELKGDFDRFQGAPLEATEHYARTKSYFQRVLALPLPPARRSRVAYGFCRAALRRGDSFAALGDLEQAREEYDLLLKMANEFLPQAMDNMWLEILVAGEMAYASVEEEQGRLVQARARLRRTLERFEAVGPHAGTGVPGTKPAASSCVRRSGGWSAKQAIWPRRCRSSGTP